MITRILEVFSTFYYLLIITILLSIIQFKVIFIICYYLILDITLFIFI
jgi:hypothetical protein